jgi:hypothetical protein
MTKSKHPLDDEFKIDGSPYDDEYDDEVVIPDSREEQDLSLVIELALRQYKMNADDMSLEEPKNRIKIMEINYALLNTAKDARYKLERLRMEREKMVKAKGTGTSSVGSEASDEPPATISRSELAERRRERQLKAVK